MSTDSPFDLSRSDRPGVAFDGRLPSVRPAAAAAAAAAVRARGTGGPGSFPSRRHP